MGRVNRDIEGVFVNIVGNEKERSSFDRFLDYGNSLANKNSKNLNQFVKYYQDLITDVKTTVNQLAELEVIIMQLRTKENLTNEDIKLNIVRNEYIYARCPFFRTDKTTKDIRVIVDNVEFWGSDLKKLSGNEKFMGKAYSKLIDAMDNEIYDNISKYEKIYTEEKIS
jgi:hypothetical protein